MLKMAFVGTILGATGWAIIQSLRHDGRQNSAVASGSEDAQMPGNVLSIEAYRKEQFRQQGRPADALRVARAAVDLRMRDLMERDAA